MLLLPITGNRRGIFRPADGYQRHVWMMLIDLLYHGKFPAAIFATGVKEHDEGNLPPQTFMGHYPSVIHGDAEHRQLVSCNQLYTSCIGIITVRNTRNHRHTTAQRYKEYTIYQLFHRFSFMQR